MNESVNLDSFKYIWTSDFNDYALLRFNHNAQDIYLIYHLINKTILMIEDNAEYAAVKSKMMQMRMRVVDDGAIE